MAGAGPTGGEPERVRDVRSFPPHQRFTFAAGLRSALASGASVVNLSLGYGASAGETPIACSGPLAPSDRERCDAVQALEDRDVVLVSIAQNYGLAKLPFPANVPTVIPVGGVQPTAVSSGPRVTTRSWDPTTGPAAARGAGARRALYASRERIPLQLPALSLLASAWTRLWGARARSPRSTPATATAPGRPSRLPGSPYRRTGPLGQPVAVGGRSTADRRRDGYRSRPRTRGLGPHVLPPRCRGSAPARPWPWPGESPHAALLALLARCLAAPLHLQSHDRRGRGRGRATRAAPGGRARATRAWAIRCSATRTSPAAFASRPRAATLRHRGARGILGLRPEPRAHCRKCPRSLVPAVAGCTPGPIAPRRGRSPMRARRRLCASWRPAAM
jgi:hypothetical protein